MILKILLLSLIFIVISLILIFLAQILGPAVKKQTDLKEDMLFHQIEHNFEKLKVKETIPEVKEKAYVLCSCNKKFENTTNLVLGRAESCSVIFTAYRSVNDCKYSCIGLGDCVKKCNQEAIYIENGTARINELCNGCGKCLDACPKSLIKLVPVTEKEIVACSNKDLKLTTCSDFGINEIVSYSEKKGFKIWIFWYKIFHKTSR